MKTMFIFLIGLFLISCTTSVPVKRTYKVKPKITNHNDKIKSCIAEMLSVHGVKAKDAKDICLSIYRR